MDLLAGRVAVVTGAGRGVGRAEALALAAEGAHVVVNDLGSDSAGRGAETSAADRVVAEIEAAGGRAVADYGDVATSAGGKAVVDAALDAFGRIDILVNNAGILRDRMVFNMSDDEWDDVLRVHLTGHFAPTRRATEHWRELARSSGKPVDGRIVCTSSQAGLFGNAGQANYAAAKAGIAAFTVVVAREVSKYGVTCNAICPRARTRLMTETIRSVRGDDPGAREGVEAAPGGNGEQDAPDLLDPSNVGAFAAALAAPAAGHITGQVFVVGGGRVQLAEGWRVVSELSTTEPWTTRELVDRFDDLFGDRPTVPVEFADLLTVAGP